MDETYSVIMTGLHFSAEGGKTTREMKRKDRYHQFLFNFEKREAHHQGKIFSHFGNKVTAKNLI